MKTLQELAEAYAQREVAKTAVQMADALIAELQRTKK